MIESTGSVDDNTRVVFYKTGECNPDDEIAQGNIDCIAVADDGLPTYLSFNVVAEPTNPAVGSPPKPRALSRDQKRADRIPDVVSFNHGAVHLADGKKYRMHQVYSTGFFAIPEEEWDDKINIQNEEDLPQTDDSIMRRWEARSSSNYTSRDLEERSFNLDTCKAAINCAKSKVQQLGSNVGTAGVNLAQAAPVWLSNAAAAAASRGQTFVEFMDAHTFYCSLGLVSITLLPLSRPANDPEANMETSYYYWCYRLGCWKVWWAAMP